MDADELLEVATFMDTALKKVNEEQAIIKKDKERNSMSYNSGMDDQIRKRLGV